MRHFVYRKRNGEFSTMVGIPSVMVAAGVQIVRGHGPFGIKKNSNDVQPFKKRLDCLASLYRNLQNDSEVGDTFRVRAEGADVVFLVREAKPAVHVIDTNGNDKCDRMWTYVKAHHKVYFLGAFVCKQTVPGVWSQHAFANAIDIGAHSMAELLLIAKDCVDAANAFDVEHVIVADRIWTRSVGWHPYSGEYHHHVHVDFDPQGHGIPACAI